MNYKGSSSIQKMAKRATKERIAQTEYRNYDDYMNAQKDIHQHLHAKPADMCELCGYAMDYNGHQLSAWEQKWSIHEVCRDKMGGMLDRETGIARERRELERRSTGKRF